VRSQGAGKYTKKPSRYKTRETVKKIQPGIHTTKHQYCETIEINIDVRFVGPFRVQIIITTTIPLPLYP